MFPWASVLQLVLRLTIDFVSWQRDRALLDAGVASAITSNLKASDELISHADAARARVRDRARSAPDSVRDEDDGHRRD